MVSYNLGLISVGVNHRSYLYWYRLNLLLRSSNIVVISLFNMTPTSATNTHVQGSAQCKSQPGSEKPLVDYVMILEACIQYVRASFPTTPPVTVKTTMLRFNYKMQIHSMVITNGVWYNVLRIITLKIFDLTQMSSPDHSCFLPLQTLI